ncbi:hypothetical protein PoHVEF18_006082 [Penicillium ochrochloron]
MTRPFDDYSGLWWFPEQWSEDDDVHFPLDKLLRRANADPESKPYLQNLRDVYIINEFPCHANVHDNYNRTDFMVFCGHKHTLETLDLDVDSHLPMLRDWDENKVEEYFAEKDPAWHADGEEEALEFKFLTSIWKQEGSLSDFTALKSLTMGIGLLLYFVKGVFLNPGSRGGPIMFVDCLPENLENLCIRGYQRGLNENWDAQVDALLAHYKSGKSNLKSLTGIEEMIPNAVDLKEPIRPRNMRWTLEKIGYELDEG